MSENFDWIESALNGSGTHAWEPWYPAQSGDMLAGEVVERGEQPTKYGPLLFLDVKIERSTVGGESLEPGRWARLYVGTAVLKRWVSRDDPQPGDKIAVRYRGIVERGQYKTHAFDAGTLKAERAWSEDESWT
jgi:hypothetical protein